MFFAARLAALCFAAGLALATAFEGPATRDAPPPGHTGGFGEPTCQDCHFQAGINQGNGTLSLLGLPAAFDPGTTYHLTILLAQSGLAAGGFQMSARFQDGMQAGDFAVAPGEASRSAVTAAGAVQYIHHLYRGTVVRDADTLRWPVQWTAPACARPVVFHLAASAADDDDSPLGDFVYATSRVVQPAAGDTAARSHVR